VPGGVGVADRDNPLAVALVVQAEQVQVLVWWVGVAGLEFVQEVDQPLVVRAAGVDVLVLVVADLVTQVQAVGAVAVGGG
jgi:hypothetical protein